MNISAAVCALCVVCEWETEVCAYGWYINLLFKNFISWNFEY